MRRFAGVAVAVALVVGAAVGCDGTDDEAPAADGTRVLVYLLRGEKVGAAAREVPEAAQPEAAALEELLEGPTAAESGAGLGTAIPPGTRLEGVTIEDGVATVDLSAEFDGGADSTEMAARLAQVVHTLTRFPSVSAVRLAPDGGSQDRADFEDQSPSVLVETPAVGDTVSDRFRLQGTANTFEATFEYEVLAPDGEKLAASFVTATCGTGCRGTFDEEVSFDPGDATEVTLVVFERSAEDGSRTREVRIPLDVR